MGAGVRASGYVIIHKTFLMTMMVAVVIVVYNGGDDWLTEGCGCAIVETIVVVGIVVSDGR